MGDHGIDRGLGSHDQRAECGRGGERDPIVGTDSSPAARESGNQNRAAPPLRTVPSLGCRSKALRLRPTRSRATPERYRAERYVPVQ